MGCGGGRVVVHSRCVEARLQVNKGCVNGYGEVGGDGVFQVCWGKTIGKMHDSVYVGKMHESVYVGKMHDSVYVGLSTSLWTMISSN